MFRSLLLALATLASAAAFPRYEGYVSDFAHRLSDGEREALENRLREYERQSGNEVAIAIVESLEGRSVEDYARELFHDWGIGKKDKNNGVLLLWAPVERKVRIQVGYGLEGTLSDSAAADILRDVTAAFRREDYTGGLNAGGHGILARLEGTEAPRRPGSGVSGTAVVGGAAGLATASVFLVMGVRRRQLAASLPKDLQRAGEALREADGMRESAARALGDLQREAPQEVWGEHSGAVTDSAMELRDLYADLSRVQAMPLGSLGELNRAHSALKRWNTRFTALWNRLDGPGKTLAGYRYCCSRGPVMLRQLGEDLARRNVGGGWSRSAKLEQAAADTYDRARAAAGETPANWLLIYDLAADAADCLECADNPGRYTRSERYWAASGGYSPAYDLLMMQAAAASSSSSSSSWSDSGMSSGGGDSGGSFGGGDSGGGGASSSY